MARGRESGMPEEATWTRFFEFDCALTKLGCGRHCRNVLEFGCGYGHFTQAAARRVAGTVFALDIDPEMIAVTRSRLDAAGLSNVRLELRDFLEVGSGRPGASVDFVMVFNILHIEQPVDLLREARRVLVPGGRVGIIHWNYDPSTPRGPSMEIRPRPEQCRRWGEEAGLRPDRFDPLDCCPYHYALVLVKR